MTQTLEWVAKAFTPGDFDGAGQERILGMSRLSAVEILIRETAQNSWDARLKKTTPRFRVELRRAGGPLRQALDQLLGSPATLGLDEAWSDPDLRLIEIADRGTTGLDGPYQLGASPIDSTENYKDLILKLGVPREDGGGGGTYGFGKTAAYAFSRRGTLVYWTRCWHDGELQHRLIGSAMGSSFEKQGTEYTGRHWWGATASDGTILPLLGEQAREVGEQIFGIGFEGDETGTSILVIDPVLKPRETDDAEGEPTDERALHEVFADEARSAIRQNLWPKLTPEPATGRAPMDIGLIVDGDPIDLGDSTRGAWKHWADALNAIRYERSASTDETGDRVAGATGAKVIPIQRYSEIVGHLAIVRRLQPPAEIAAADDLDPSGAEIGYRRLALMRGQAELVVTTVEGFPEAGAGGFDWIAVYKAANSRDAHYAATEPPAHDDWVLESATGDPKKLLDLTKRKVRQELRQALSSADLTKSGSAGISTVMLARELGGLLPAPDTDLSPDSASSVRRAPAPAVRRPWRLHELGRSIVPSHHSSLQRWAIDFEVDGPGDYAEVLLQVRIDSDDRSITRALSAEQLQTSWSGFHDLHDNGTQAYVGRGARLRVEFSGPRGRAVSAHLSVKDAD